MTSRRQLLNLLLHLQNYFHCAIILIIHLHVSSAFIMDIRVVPRPLGAVQRVLATLIINGIMVIKCQIQGHGDYWETITECRSFANFSQAFDEYQLDLTSCLVCLKQNLTRFYWKVRICRSCYEFFNHYRDRIDDSICPHREDHGSEITCPQCRMNILKSICVKKRKGGRPRLVPATTTSAASTSASASPPASFVSYFTWNPDQNPNTVAWQVTALFHQLHCPGRPSRAARFNLTMFGLPQYIQQNWPGALHFTFFSIPSLPNIILSPFARYTCKFEFRGGAPQKWKSSCFDFLKDQLQSSVIGARFAESGNDSASVLIIGYIDTIFKGILFDKSDLAFDALFCNHITDVPRPTST